MGKQLSPQLPVSSGIPLTSILFSLLFPIFINDFSVSITYKYSQLFPGRSQSDIPSDIRSGYAAKPALKRVMLDDTENVLLVCLFQHTYDLGVIADSEFKYDTHVTATVWKDR